MPLDDKALKKELNAFFRKELNSLDEATGRAIKIAANSLANKIRGQLNANFSKTSHRNSPQFFKAVKAYHLEPREDLGYASFVRMGVKKFMHVFEDGAVINARKKPFLVIRLPFAWEKLGLPRVNSKGSLSAVLQRLPKNSVFIKDKKDGTKIVFYKAGKGQYIPIYKIQTTVVLGRRLSFYKTADQEAAKIPELIERFNNG